MCLVASIVPSPYRYVPGTPWHHPESALLHQPPIVEFLLHKNLLTEHLGQGYFCGEPNQL